jgi:hypothetical protein
MEDGDGKNFIVVGFVEDISKINLLYELIFPIFLAPFQVWSNYYSIITKFVDVESMQKDGNFVRSFIGRRIFLSPRAFYCVFYKFFCSVNNIF